MSRAAGLAMLTVLLMFSGCTATYDGLLREAQVPYLAALASASGLDQARTYLVPTTRGDGPLVHIAVHEIDSPGATETLVFVHGVLADHSTWRFLAGALTDVNLIMIDFPGAGASDVPNPRHLLPDGFSPSAKAERAIEALRLRLDERQRGRLYLVGHSLGGGAVLRMWCDSNLREQNRDVLDRFRGLILIAPLDVAMPVPHPVFQQLAGAGDLRYDAASALGVMREQVAIATRRSVVEPTRALREEADKRLEFLMDSARRRAMQATLAQAIPLRDDRPDWDEIERLTAGYAQVDLPAIIIWGARDETLPLSMGYKLAAELPQARLEVISRARHSPHLERPDGVADAIRRFIDDLDR
jgi:pimeloyl-ACP methyl ester carboxylesterase